MNLLHTVEFYAPSRGGAQEVVRQVSERLVRRGHQVTVATTRLPERQSDWINGVRVQGFTIRGNAVRGFHGEVERYQNFLLDGDFDLMLNYAAQQWATDLVFPIIDRLTYRKVLVPCGFSGLDFPDYSDYFRQIPQSLRRYDRLVFHTAHYRDLEFTRAHGIENWSIIPNGAARDEFEAPPDDFRERYAIPPATPLVLTVGAHTGAKGHAAAMRAFRQVQVGAAYLVMIGNRPAGESCLGLCRRAAAWTGLASRGCKRVLLLDPPRAEVAAAYRAADLFVFPSNIEYAPLVLYEAMAAGLPFLTTPVGNAAEIVASGGGELLPAQRTSTGWVDVDVPSLTQSMERLLRSPQERRKLGAAGRAAWELGHTWEEIALQYERLYTDVLCSRGEGTL